MVERRQALLAGTSAGDLFIWRAQKLPPVLAEAGVQARVLSGHRGRLQALLSSAAGDNDETAAPDYVFSAGADRTVRVWAPWQAEGGAALQTLVGHTGTVTCLAWTGAALVTGSTDRTLRVWRRLPGPGQHALRHPVLACAQTLGPFADWLTALVAVPGADPAALFAADARGAVHQLSLGGGGGGAGGAVLRRRRTEPIHERAVSDLVVVAAEHLLVTLSFDGTLQVHEAETGAGLFAVANPNRCRYTGVAWDPVHHDLVAVDAAGYLQVWNVGAERCRKVQQLRRGPLTGVALVGDAVVVGAPECVEVWRLSRCAGGGTAHDHAAHQGAVVGLLRGPDRQLWSASVDNTVRAWTAAAACAATLREADASEISAFGHIPDTNLLVTGLDSGQLHVWNADTGSALTLAPGAHTNAITALAVVRAPRRRDLLVTGGYDRRVLVWDVTTRRRAALQPSLDHELVRHAGAREVLCVAHHPESGTLLAGGTDAVVQVWDVETYEGRGLLVGHRDAVTALAADGNLILSGADDGDVRIWDAVHRQCVDVLRAADSAPVRGLGVAQPGGIVVVAHADAQIRLWDYVQRAVTASWRMPHGAEPRALFIEDGVVRIGCENGTITTFAIPAASGSGDDFNKEGTAVDRELDLDLPLDKPSIETEDLLGPPTAEPT